MACLLLDELRMRKDCALLLFLLTGCGSAVSHPSSNSNDALDRNSIHETWDLVVARLHAGDAPIELPPPVETPPVDTPPVETPPVVTPPAPSHKRCGWIGGNDTVGESAFVKNAAQYDTIHPKWWALSEADGVSVRKAGNPDLASVVDAARANHVRIMPLVDGLDADLIRSMMNDTTKRAKHVANLVQLAKDHGYDGLDMDYEHLWTAADRPGFVAFMSELAAAMHAAGLELSMAIGAIEVDHGNNGYPYEKLVDFVDTLHVMTYDFHYISNSHLGPIAPLGWVDAVFARAEATGHPEKFMLGLANYAIGNGWWTTAHDALTQCGGAMQGATTHMQSCPFGAFEAGRSPHCTTSKGEVWFEDVGSMEEKIQTAKRHGARGVTYWTVGDELDGYFDMVRRNFP